MGKKKAEAAQPQAPERRPPAHEVRCGRIRATVWENHHPEQGRWFSVTITRTYKQGEQYKTANSFGRDDLLVVSEVARQAFLWISQQNGTNVGGESNTPPTDEVPI